MTMASIERALEAFREGKFVCRGRRREPRERRRSDPCCSGCDAGRLGFMVRHTSGLICLPTTGERLDELDIPMMVLENTDSFQTAFTISSTMHMAPLRGSRQQIERGRSWPSWTRAHNPRTSVAPDTSFPFATTRAASSSVQDTPRPQSTSPGWPGCIRPGSCARSSTTTAP